MTFVADGEHMSDGKKSICIISFSPIYRDGRVLRQIRYLSVRYDLTVIGYGKPPSDWVNRENIKWYPLELMNSMTNKTPPPESKTLVSRQWANSVSRSWVGQLLHSIIRKFKPFLGHFLLGLGRCNTRLYEIWFWRNKYRSKALQYALQSECDAYHANDWEALPVAAEAANVKHAKLVFDAHEYAPLELENRWYWKMAFKPTTTYFIKKYVSQISASVTVAPLISDRYKKEFGFGAAVILNAPEAEPLPVNKSSFENIRLVHHGGCIRDRKLERLIETLGRCDRRFSLHLMLINNDPTYLNRLKRRAEILTPGRVFFHEPVPPEQIVKRISEFDIGFYLLEPNSFNNIAALPNKFFDFIVAGLAVCVGPSPSMAEFVNQYGLGCVAPSFEPADVANTLNELTIADISNMRAAAQEASKKINAQNEMKKLVDLYDSCLKF